MFSDLHRPPLGPSAVGPLLSTSRLWREVQVVADIGSTSTELASRAARDDLAEGLVIAADHQSAGRGRLGRTWTAPPRSSLAVSALLGPREVDLGRWSWLPLLTGLAMVDVLQTIGGLPARLKWPNDVLVGGRKVCGVLAEVVTTPSGPMAVVGAGLNVSLSAAELPVPTASSLLLEGSATVDRAVLLRAYLRALEHRYLRWREAGGEPRRSGIGAAYREVCSTIGLEVSVSLPAAGELAGTADGVDDLGRLLVTDGIGHTHALAAGDVIHVR